MKSPTYHRMTFRKNLSIIGFTLIWLMLPVVLLLITKTFSISLLLIVFLIAGPGLFLHIRYYLMDKHKEISFTSKHLEIKQGDSFHKIVYTDILKVEHHYHWWPYKIPYGNYGYVKVFTHDKTYKFTCFVHDDKSSSHFFESKGLHVKKCERMVPW